MNTDIDRMVRHWRDVNDEALVEAVERLDEFTEQGRGVVLDELRRRGLAVPPPAGEAPRGDPLLVTDEVEVWRGSGITEAEPLLAVLRANGVPARPGGEVAGRILGLTVDGLGEVGILVPAERADEARALLAASDDAAVTPEDVGVDGAIRGLIADYIRSIDEADTALAAEVWATDLDVMRVDPRGTERGWQEVRENFYQKRMKEMFSSRALTIVGDVAVQVYADAAIAYFWWDFKAAFANGRPFHEMGRETQVYAYVDATGWRLVHVHASGPPEVGEREGV